MTAADTQLDAWSGRQLLLLAVEIAAPGSAADDPQQHQHWDWHEALILQQQLNREDYPNATSESLELGKQSAQPSVGTSGSSGSISNSNDASKEDREPPTVRWSLHVSLNCCCCSRFRLIYPLRPTNPEQRFCSSSRCASIAAALRVPPSLLEPRDVLGGGISVNCQ